MSAEKEAIMPASVFDRFPKPPCAELLGWTLLGHDKATTRIGFEGRPEFLNPAGFVQGGMLAAMLDDAMGPGVLLATDGRFYTATIGLNVSYLAPARVGRLVAEARVIQLGKTVGFMDASLSDSDGTVVARATSSARLVPAERLLA
jgi:uncharacterized protein (TIGR00369 family)